MKGTLHDGASPAITSHGQVLLMRGAVPSDASAAAALIHLPMGRLADHLFGSDNTTRARQVLEKLFVQRSNRFSHEFCTVLELEGEVTGLLLAYPGSLLKNLAVPMGNQLREILGWQGMLRLLKRSMPFLRSREAEPDEYYIYTLAVRPDCQSGGLGARLLAHAEWKARVAGLPKCSLGVTLDNHAARRFYERHAFEVVDTVRTPALEKAINYPGYHRMVKPLNRRPGETV